jgi:FMN phosphatase YigB (HAD superfamily)
LNPLLQLNWRRIHPIKKMNSMTPEKLIIFDYSGTLSLNAVLFARPEHLMKELRESGLSDLGVTSPEIFWKEIVNPTWEEGSTTSVGYKGVIVERIRERFSPAASDDMIALAASRFVENYLGHSRVDESWQHILRVLDKNSDVCVVIATDHYAEATDYIMKHLGELGVHAVTAKEPVSDPEFVVANSADLGVHKADYRFWEILKANLRLDSVRQILLIDDFGFNEAGGDSYGELGKVLERREKTVGLLEKVFPVDVQAVPFMIKYEQHYPVGNPKTNYRALIAETSMIIKGFL